MDNVWVVVPVRNNNLDLSEFVGNLSGGFVAPETYEKVSFSMVDGEYEKEAEIVEHPYAGQTADDLSGRIVFINAEEGYVEFEGVTHLEDFAEHNIARWMNTGIDHAVENGASKVVVLSNPASFDMFALKDILDSNPDSKVINIADGAMFVVSGDSDYRLDEQFKIWFWADDFYRRLDGNWGGNTSEYLGFSELIPYHVDTEELQEVVKVDEANYNAKWS